MEMIKTAHEHVEKKFSRQVEEMLREHFHPEFTNQSFCPDLDFTAVTLFLLHHVRQYNLASQF